MKDTKSCYYMLMKPIAHSPIALQTFMEFSFLNNLLYFISLLLVRHLPCVIEGVGVRRKKNTYISRNWEGSMGNGEVRKSWAL